MELTHSTVPVSVLELLPFLTHVVLKELDEWMQFVPRNNLKYAGEGIIESGLDGVVRVVIKCSLIL